MIFPQVAMLLTKRKMFLLIPGLLLGLGITALILPQKAPFSAEFLRYETYTAVVRVSNPYKCNAQLDWKPGWLICNESASFGTVTVKRTNTVELHFLPFAGVRPFPSEMQFLYTPEQSSMLDKINQLISKCVGVSILKPRTLTVSLPPKATHQGMTLENQVRILQSDLHQVRASHHMPAATNQSP